VGARGSVKGRSESDRVKAGRARAGVPAAGRVGAGVGAALRSRAGVAAVGEKGAGVAWSGQALVVGGGSADGSAMMKKVRFPPDVENRGGVMAVRRAKQAAAASSPCTAGKRGPGGGGSEESGFLNTRRVKQTLSTTASMTRIRAADQRLWCTHYFGASAPQANVRGDRQSVAGLSPGRRPRWGCGGAAGGPLSVPLQLLTEPRRQRGLDC